MQVVKDSFLVVDCGSNFIKKLQQVIEKQRVKCQVVNYNDISKITPNFTGIIISGSPLLLTENDLSPFMAMIDKCINSERPILGICCGHQLLGIKNGASITKGELKKGEEKIITKKESFLFENITNGTLFREAHREEITLPLGYELIATSKRTKVEAIQHKNKPWFGVQFHPETSGIQGEKIIQNFIKIANL